MKQKQLITMTKQEAQRYKIINNLFAKKIDGSEAAKQLQLSVRQTKRLKAKVRQLGIKGIIHGNRGKKSNRQIDQKIVHKAKAHLQEMYYDFNPLLAQEHLRDDHNIVLSKETVRQLMINEKLWHPKKKMNVKKHFWRERKDNYGEMQQFDGSYHNWFEGRNEAIIGLEQCLLLSVDDATGKITGAVFEDNEGVFPVFRFWKGYIEAHGLPQAIYLDKFSTYKVNHKNAVDNQELMTQFERAMHQLGVRVIHANSPQAKGRVEKMNSTLQRRLVKEMRLNKINTIEDANIYLKEIFIPQFNQQFAVIAKKEADLHQQLDDTKMLELANILSVQNERVINNDYTIQFKKHYYQLTQTQPITVYKKDKIIIEEHLNGDIKISTGKHYLNYFCLPARPKKEIDVKLVALTTKPSTTWKPPINHPWRRPFLFTQKQPLLVTTKGRL